MTSDVQVEVHCEPQCWRVIGLRVLYLVIVEIDGFAGGIVDLGALLYGIVNISVYHVQR